MYFLRHCLFCSILAGLYCAELPHVHIVHVLPQVLQGVLHVLMYFSSGVLSCTCVPQGVLHVLMFLNSGGPSCTHLLKFRRFFMYNYVPQGVLFELMYCRVPSWTHVQSSFMNSCTAGFLHELMYCRVPSWTRVLQGSFINSCTAGFLHELMYRPFHKTLPRSIASVNWIWVRFY